MDSAKFIVYSDIHYDRLGARCITIDDCVSVETAIFRRAIETQCSFVLFCGDRFLKREPEDEVKTRSDNVFRGESNYDGDIPAFSYCYLVGNHDWTKNSMDWHTSNSLRDINFLYMMDIPRSVYMDDVIIHSLPAGFQFNIENYDLQNKDKLNLFTFHDMLKGSFLDDDEKYASKDGIPKEIIDRPEFDFVFGGDVHIPQRISFQNTQGGYVGSVIQRTMNDANRARGWLEVEATKTNEGWNVETQFCPTRNFFTKFSFEVDENTQFEGLSMDENLIVDQFVEVSLIGRKQHVDRIFADERWENLKTFCQARDFELLPHYEMEQDEVIVNMSQSTGVLDDLNTYINSGFVDTDDLLRDGVMEAVIRMMEE